MAQHSRSSRIWSASLDQKKDELAGLLAELERRRRRKASLSQMPVMTVEEAVQSRSFDDFQSAMQSLAQQYSHRKVPVLLKKYLYPTFDHVRSFQNGISSATQYEPNAALSWGIVLIVLQCACIFAENLEEILSHLGDVQGLLPYLHMDLSLYSNSRTIANCLRRIFESYITFCVAIVKHLASMPVVALIKNLVSSSLKRTLKKTREQLKNEVAEFDRAIGIAERSRSIQVDGAILQAQTQQLLMLSNASATATSTARSKVQWPVSSMNIARNPDFIGRDLEMAKLLQWVKAHQETRPLACTIHGVGGIGKTETATELAYRCQDLFDAVLWIPADPEQETETLRTFGQIGRHLGLFDTAEINDPQVEIVLNWLRTEDRRWLLVFDNVENWKEIARYWPMRSCKNCVIICTSQRETPWVDYSLELEPFDDLAGSKFLLRQMHKDQLLNDDQTVEMTKDISHQLGGSPLFLTAAQGFMAISGSTIHDYLEILRAGSTTLDVKNKSTWRYGKAASTTHDKILEKLSSGATTLLFMFAFMNPDDIDEQLLLNLNSDVLSFMSDKAIYISFVAELGEGRLVRRTPLEDSYRLSIHRTTQAAMRQKMNKTVEHRDLYFQKVVHLIRENFSETSSRMKLQIAEAHVWPRITKVLPHLMSTFNYFEDVWPGIKGDMFFAELLSEVAGMDLYDRGRINEAYRINKMVEKILINLKQSLESPLMANALAIVGLCSDFMALTKRQEGLEIRQRGVQIREHCHASLQHGNITLEDKVWLHNSYTDLVCSLQQINDFEGARQNLDHCFTQYQLWGTEDEIPYEYSKYYNQMAYVLLYENEGARAVEFSKKGYELVEQAAPGTQITVLYKFDYANILFQHGEQSKALEMLKDLLKACKRDCGKDNVRTLEVRLNIGIICYFMKNFEQAEKHIRKVLDMNKRDLWPIENIVRGKYYLSQILKASESPDQAAAARIEHEAKEGLERLLAMDTCGKAQEYGDDLPMLYDYLVHWECRLITPRKVSGLST